MKYLCYLLFSFFVGCSGNEKGGQTQTANLAQAEATAASAPAPTDRDIKTDIEMKPDVGAEQRIIRTADARFRVDDLQKSKEKITSIIAKYQGLVVSSNMANSGSELNYNMTIRVANQQFDALLDELLKESNHTDYRNVNAQDVSEEYVDIEARLKTKKELEKSYLNLLKQAKKVEDILAIEEKLSGVREEVEAKEGRLKYLRDQVSRSTINIGFYQQIASYNDPKRSFFTRISENFVQGFSVLGDFVAGILLFLPLLVVLAVVVWLARKWWGRRH